MANGLDDYDHLFRPVQPGAGAPVDQPSSRGRHAEPPASGNIPVTGAFAPVPGPTGTAPPATPTPANAFPQVPEHPAPPVSRTSSDRLVAGGRRGQQQDSGPKYSEATIRAAKRKRWAVISSAFLSTAVLLATGLVWGGFMLANTNLGRSANPEVVSTAPEGAQNILLVGVDDLKGISRKQRAALALGGDRSGKLTDTIMFMRLSEDHKRVTVVSIPRDTYVNIPRVGMQKINGAYAHGGIKTTTKVVKQLTGMPINYSIEVNPMAIVRIVAALDGITVCVPTTINDPKIRFTLQKGAKVNLTPTEASKFTRTRSIGNDFGRMQRQQGVISAILKKALSGETLASPGKLTGFITEAARSVKVSDNLTTQMMIDLGAQLKDIDMNKVQFTQLPVANPDYHPDAKTVPPTPAPSDSKKGKEKEPEVNQGQSVILHDVEQTKQLFAAIKADRPLKPESEKPQTGEKGPKPEDVEVQVLNGGGVDGMGATAKKDLEDAGFVVPEEAGNAKASGNEKSVVRYTKDHEAEAKLVASKFDNVELKQVKKGKPVTLIIGKGYEGLKDPKPPEKAVEKASTAAENNKAVDCKAAADT